MGNPELSPVEKVQLSSAETKLDVLMNGQRFSRLSQSSGAFPEAFAFDSGDFDAR